MNPRRLLSQLSPDDAPPALRPAVRAAIDHAASLADDDPATAARLAQAARRLIRGKTSAPRRT